MKNIFKILITIQLHQNIADNHELPKIFFDAYIDQKSTVPNTAVSGDITKILVLYLRQGKYKKVFYTFGVLVGSIMEIEELLQI